MELIHINEGCIPVTFKKGNPSKLGQKNPNAGRKPSRKTLIKRWDKDNPLAVAQLMEVLYQAGLEEIEIKCPHCNNRVIVSKLADKDCAMYVVDRLRGRPRQEIDSRIKVLQLSVSGDDLARLQLQYEEQERMLLDGGKNGAQGTSQD